MLLHLLNEIATQTGVLALDAVGTAHAPTPHTRVSLVNASGHLLNLRDGLVKAADCIAIAVMTHTLTSQTNAGGPQKRLAVDANDEVHIHEPLEFPLLMNPPLVYEPATYSPPPSQLQALAVRDGSCVLNLEARETWTLTTSEPVWARTDVSQTTHPDLAARLLTLLSVAPVGKTGDHSTLDDQSALYELVLLRKSNVRFGLFICAGGMRSPRR